MVQRRNSGEAATGPWRPMRVRTEAWSVWSDPTDGLKLHAGSDRKLSGWPPSPIESTNNENWTTERWRKVAASFLHKQERSVQHSDKFEVLTLIFKRSQSSRASVRCAGQTSRIPGGSTPQLAGPTGPVHLLSPRLDELWCYVWSRKSLNGFVNERFLLLGFNKWSKVAAAEVLSVTIHTVSVGSYLLDNALPPGECKLKHSRDIKSFYEAREQQQHSGTKGTTEGQNKSYQSARAPFIIKDSPDSETWSRPFSSKYLQVLDLVRDSVTEALEEKTCTPGASVHELRAQTWCCYSTAWKTPFLQAGKSSLHINPVKVPTWPPRNQLI